MNLSKVNYFRLYKKEHLILGVIVLFALSLRLFFIYYFDAQRITSIDKIVAMKGVDDGWAFGYEAGRIAKSIAEGKGFSSPFPFESGPTAWLMPGYPLLLALIFKIFGVYTTKAMSAALLINSLVSALTCIPVYHISKKLFGRDVGVIAGVALALYPPSIWHAVNTIWDTTIFTFLAMIIIQLLLFLPGKLNRMNAALYGLLLGVGALVNAAIIAFYPFILVWLLLQKSVSIRTRIGVVTVMFIAAGVVMSPWILRNFFVLGRPMLRSNLGVELKLGNNPNAVSLYEADGTVGSFWQMGHPSIEKYEFERYSHLGEVKYGDLCFDETLGFVRENPDKFLILTLARIRNFWLSSFSKNEWKGQLNITFSVSLFKNLCYLIPFPFSLIGILVALKRRIKIAPLLGFLFLTPVVYYVTHVTQRYRYPIEPLIVIFAGYGLYSLIQYWKDGIHERMSPTNNIMAA